MEMVVKWPFLLMGILYQYKNAKNLLSFGSLQLLAAKEHSDVRFPDGLNCQQMKTFTTEKFVKLDILQFPKSFHIRFW